MFDGYLLVSTRLIVSGPVGCELALLVHGHIQTNE